MKCFQYKLIVGLVLWTATALPVSAQPRVGLWMKFEQVFTSDKAYENPLYEVNRFSVKLVSPGGRVRNIDGFWDGGTDWKFRFAPDEKGRWTWQSVCSDQENRGLNNVSGSFVCTDNGNDHPVYRHGSVMRPKGLTYLTHADGTPFFWAACTAWNGTLKSTDEEWDRYLQNRSESGYSVIQFVTTQWRGCDKNSLGQVAFEGSGKIKVNPDFFRHLDGKMDKINGHGLVAAPVLLWALGTVQGRELSPGYYLPDEEAILLARYMVARYGGNQVVWILGGDGKYTGENECRWKNIGRKVFGKEHPGAVALHPGGSSWIGEVYSGEDWLDIIGYQSGHSKSEATVRFMTAGPVSTMWDKLPPRPMINMEPLYEEIYPDVADADIRNASYWSVLNAPTAGISYGANGLWPWLRDGEVIQNHVGKGETASRWYRAMELPGSVQVGRLANFFRTLPWWQLRPSSELLAEQPGAVRPADFISVSSTDDKRLIVLYSPRRVAVKLHNVILDNYKIRWLDPISGREWKGKAFSVHEFSQLTPPLKTEDFIVVLERKK